MNVADFYNSHTFPGIGKDGIYTFAKMKRHLFQKLNLPFSYFDNKKILEAGSGTGESTLIYHYFKPKELIGIDIASESIKMAKKTAAELNIKSEFYTMDLNEVEKLDKKFDFIMCEVLHQTQDPVKGLKKLCGVLEHDGLIVVAIAHKYGNYFDIVRRKFVSFFSGNDDEKTVKLAKKLFYNKFAMNSKTRGVNKKDYANLDKVIADIYIHPFRRNISNNELLNWLEECNLKYVSSYPSISGKNQRINVLTKMVGNFRLLFGGDYHISVLAQKN